jgi:predicted outer membrane repeat protein
LTPTVNYNCIQGLTGALGGTGNIDTDPCFAEANNGDYHLRAGSLCINAGDPNYVAAPNEVDLDGKERVLGGRIDMGAYEYQELTIYVDGDAPGPTHDGSSWANAYKYLQDALTDAGSAAKTVEILIAQGIYKPDQSSADPCGSGDNTAKFQLINGVTIQGGYAGFGEPDPYARDIEFYETILSGDLNGDDGPNFANMADNSLHVVNGSRTETNAVLDGLTISSGLGTGMYNYGGSPALANCTFSDNMANNGGAMYNEDSNTVVTRCTFIDNSAFSFGGAVYNKECSPTFDYCKFSDNSAENGGGGMYNHKSSPTLTYCTFEGNWSGLYGGGLDTVSSSSSPTVIGCTFIGNSADRRGGGTSNGTSSLTLINCIFINNSATDEGGAMNSCNGMNINVSNCTFYGNQAPNGNLLVCSCSPFNVQFTNCIMWDGGNEIWNPPGSIITLTYSDMYGGRMSVYDPCESIIWEAGNIDADPCFADANNGDYHLKSQAGRWDPNSQSWVLDDVTSPCIDAGNPGCPLGDEPNDPNNVRINMGAYGGMDEASKSPAYWRSIADITNDWIVDSNDLKVFVSYWLQTGVCIPSDFDRSRYVDFNDFAILGGQWRQKGPGATTSYQIGSCIPPEFGLFETGQMSQTRFTVTVQGQYIFFEDMMRANCCPDELELLMTVEEDLITINEIEHLMGVPCPCICDYPITATLGPFEPGSYTLEVYQDGYFIGSTTVTIGPGS